MSSALDSLALNVKGRPPSFLAAVGIFSISPRPPRTTPFGRPKGAKDESPRGLVRRTAIETVRGAYPGKTYAEIGELAGVDPDSLKAAVNKERRRAAP